MWRLRENCFRDKIALDASCVDKSIRIRTKTLNVLGANWMKMCNLLKL